VSLDDAAPEVHHLSNGLRVLLLPRPQARGLAVSVYVACGSASEKRRNSGISHLLEHMLFKGTATRTARQINLEAERLGAELNAHTDRDHTAYHLRGLPEHLPQFIAQLADLVLHPSLPADELERERQVLLQEWAEDDDDAWSTAFRLFDQACFGTHPVALPVGGRKPVLQVLPRDALQRWHAEHFVPERMVLAIAGPSATSARAARAEKRQVLRWAEQHFVAPAASATHTAPPVFAAPPWQGGVKTRQLPGSSQAHVVLGWPLRPLAPDTATDLAPALAAAVLGEGMSSPLMHELREQRGLFYFAAASAERLATHGQFLVEASVAPKHRDAYVQAVLALLRRQAEGIDTGDWQRGRRLLEVRWLRDSESTARCLEAAALDLLFFGRVQSLAERLARLRGLSREAVRQCFERGLSTPLALGAAGQLGRGAKERLGELLARR
jgi:predicted Zn-dependent peptidase